MDGTAAAMRSVRFPLPLRSHQESAIAAAGAAADPNRCHLVLPPGAGKTLIGAELARQRGRPTLVLTPNTAIAGQWVRLWRSASGPEVRHLEVAESRDWRAPVTVLTYQAIATFDPDTDADPQRPSARLHRDAAGFLDRLAAGPPFTLVLDEAHHLAETWGRLLAEVLDRMRGGDPPFVIALTATPRSRLTPEQAELVDGLFGPVLYQIATPALVRDRVLAPFRELVRFVTPTPAESDYLRRSAQRWQELITGLLDPGFATTGFLEHVTATWVNRTDQGDPSVAWTAVERQYPEMARAVLRLHAGADLVALPPGARLREEHRRAPAVEDWVALIADYAVAVLAGSEAPQDRTAWAGLRAALASVGWTMTVRGARRGLSDVDRVLQRSAAKADAAVQIAQHEWQVRGDSVRVVVITDYERASATPSARPDEVLDTSAGSAWEAMTRLVAAAPQLNPVLVTGRTVAADPATAASLRAFARAHDPRLSELRLEPHETGCVLITGAGWTPRRWVPIVTEMFQSGACRALVGTRGLLGEGWDAAAITTLIDLTAATTATSVVQIRGRAIRTDPADPRKAAHIWTVVAVSDDHPRGDLDYRRFVAKHDGFHSVDPFGRIVPGVAHVGPDCDPFGPPPPDQRSRINGEMLALSEQYDRLAELWRVGEPYEGIDTAVVRVHGRSGAEPELDAPDAVVRAWLRPRWWIPGAAAAVGLAAGATTGAVPALLGVTVGAAGGWAADASARAIARSHALARTAPNDTLDAFGRAVADGLFPGDGTAALVRVEPGPTGAWQVRLDTRDSSAADAFARAVAQVLAPVDWPRYLVSRRLPRHGGEIWHAVPDSAGRNRAAAGRFLLAWQEHVSDGALVYAGSAQGAGLLAAVRGLDPMAVTTALELEWR